MAKALSEINGIPVLGFGTFQNTGEECYKAVMTALKEGYRHIDTAYVYGNHKEVGRAMKDSGIPRRDIFLTSKCGLSREREFRLSYADIMSQIDETLSELDVDYLDLYLIHWPCKDFPIEDSMRALNELYENGKIKSFGVSNFTINHLKEAMKVSKNPISANQVEFHPFLYQKELLDFCNDNNIALEAYSPLARGEIFKDEMLKEIAESKGIEISQLVLAWLVEKGTVALPKSANDDRIKENFQIEGIEFSNEEMDRIDSLNKNMRTISPPWNEFDY